MSSAALMLCALALDIAIGWPDRVYRAIGHPVTWLGALIAALDRRLNRERRSHRARYLLGAGGSVLCIGAALAAAGVIVAIPGRPGMALEVIAAASLIAARSLHEHVAAVRDGLSADLATGRAAVARIVGRDPVTLGEAGVARAAIESLAENLSDGVVAPLLWGAVAGLPGIAAYKAINTLDSMIGHRSPRHLAFGGFAARLDDAANFVPARVTGAAIALVGGGWRTMWRDARRHRSPNAGWPEAAMAGALGLRLSGPRAYAGRIADEPWLNAGGRDASAADIGRALIVARRATLVVAGALGLLIWW